MEAKEKAERGRAMKRSQKGKCAQSQIFRVEIQRRIRKRNKNKKRDKSQKRE